MLVRVDGGLHCSTQQVTCHDWWEKRSKQHRWRVSRSERRPAEKRLDCFRSPKREVSDGVDRSRGWGLPKREAAASEAVAIGSLPPNVISEHAYRLRYSLSFIDCDQLQKDGVQMSGPTTRTCQQFAVEGSQELWGAVIEPRIQSVIRECLWFQQSTNRGPGARK